MSDFGDWEPADSIVDGNEPDAAYVARRIHELRQFLAAATANQVVDFDDLTPDAQAVAEALGAQLTAHLLDKGRDGSALALHEGRRFLSAQPEWKDLDPDEQTTALAMTDDIVRWLTVEGTEIK